MAKTRGPDTIRVVADTRKSRHRQEPPRKRSFTETSPDGSVVIPAEVAQRYGIAPGAPLCIEELDHHLLLHRPVTHLARVYVEPTNDCPLACRTCMRNSWNEPLGQMSEKVFARVMEGVTGSPTVPSLFFGGFGEPLSHPMALQMIRRAKAAGARTEMITNGLALDERTVEQLVEMELDALWVSLDGATQECYEGVRENDGLARIVDNIRILRAVKYRLDSPTPALGIAFVAMKRNRSELTEVTRLGLRLGATQFSISNVQPHTEEMRDEILHEKTLGQSIGAFSRLDIARMDSGEEWDRSIAGILSDCGLQYSNGRASTRLEDTCPFVEKGSTSVRWDGSVSPCLPLLHSHTAYLGSRRRQVREHSFGTLLDRSLLEIWNDPGYESFRTRLLEFDFPPCLRCNGCDLMDGNQEDCYGSAAPACGGCLWAQGYVLCP
jgi:MoaA/NifB/PqqE/SkfB family radical SAM enzyme